MPRTGIARRYYRRDMPRDASDMTDRERAPIEPFMRRPKPLGWPRPTDLREVVSAILCIATTGCQWAIDAAGGPARDHVRPTEPQTEQTT